MSRQTMLNEMTDYYYLHKSQNNMLNEEAKNDRVHIVWFHLYNVWEYTKLLYDDGNFKNILGWGGGSGINRKSHRRTFWCYVNVFFLNFSIK